jgi:hypothetical protein
VQEAVRDRRQIVLVQHRSNPKVAPVVRRLVHGLAAAAHRVPPIFLPVRVNKERGLTQESTQRCRSFLFAALGATFATMLKLTRLRFYENGVVSLNLPPSAQVVGARASRTTHPRVLDGMTRLFSALAGRRFTVENPFRWHTKADVVRLIADAGCGGLIGQTRSCARPRQAKNEGPHCGLCSQCIDRRFAVLAAGRGDNDPAEAYRVDLFTGARSAGHAQTMLAVYAEMAGQIGRMNAAQFFARFGEASRALRYDEGGAEVAAQKVFDLYRRHAQDVSRVIEDGLARHRTEIRERTLPPTCLLRMVCDAGDIESTPTLAARAPGAPTAPNVFRRKGEAWEVRFAGGSDFILLPSKGAAYLHLLLQQPGKPMKAVQMAYHVAKSPKQFALGDAGPVLDRDAVSAYRAELEEMRVMMDRAERDGDVVVLGQLQKERDEILAQLRQWRGLGGRERKACDDREKVRKAVFMAVHRTIEKIRAYDEQLAEHLKPPCLQCGDEPCYNPPPGTTWET